MNHCISSTCSRMGLIYTMRGLSALSVLTVGQCEGLGVWDGQQARFPRFFCLGTRAFRNKPLRLLWEWMMQLISRTMIRWLLLIVLLHLSFALASTRHSYVLAFGKIDFHKNLFLVSIH